MSGHFFAVNGSRVVTGRITIPLYGAWFADLTLAVPDDFAAGDSVTITIGELSLKGTIARSSGFSGSRSMRVIAGAAGWRKLVASKGYSLSSGVKLSLVLADAAADAGEKIVTDSDRSLGPVFTRRGNRPAERVLKDTLDGQWWIDNLGVTQTKARASTAISTPFTILNYSGAKGRFQIATEAYQDWTPGRTFQSPLLTAAQTISSVSFVAEEGKIDTVVYTTTSAEERLLQSIRSLIREEVSRLEYGTIVEYVITQAASMKVSCKPNAANSPWPVLADVPLKAGLIGETVTPTVGAKCLIVFMDNDPSLYRCIGIEGTSQTTSFASSGDITATPGGFFKVVGGGNFVALANLVNNNFTTLVSKFNSHTHGSGVGPTTPPVVPLVGASDFPDVSCSKLKTD